MKWVVLLISLAVPTAAKSETLEDRLASIDLERRVVILAGGQFFSVPESISLEPLQTGQIIRVIAENGAAEATSIDILEPAPPEPIEE